MHTNSPKQKKIVGSLLILKTYLKRKS